MGYNHPQLPTHNHPEPPKTTKKRPQLPADTLTIYNHPQPPTTTQKLPKKAKTCHMQLFYCNLDINSETEVDLKQYMYVCLCVNIL